MKTIKIGSNGLRILEHLNSRKKELEAKMELKATRLRRLKNIEKLLENEKRV